MGAVSGFRPAGAADLDVLVGLMAALYAEDGLVPLEADRTRRVLGELLAQPSLGAVWLLVVDGEPAGYLVATRGYSLEFGGVFVLLDEVYVAPAARGLGWGTAAIRQAGAYAGAIGAAAVRLEVEHHNAHALGVYRRAGFDAHERHLMTWWVDDTP